MLEEIEGFVRLWTTVVLFIEVDVVGWIIAGIGLICVFRLVYVISLFSCPSTQSVSTYLALLPCISSLIPSTELREYDSLLKFTLFFYLSSLPMLLALSICRLLYLFFILTLLSPCLFLFYPIAIVNRPLPSSSFSLNNLLICLSHQ